jgi:hypothetical protein
MMMAGKRRMNHDKPWTPEDVNMLKQLVRAYIPARVIGLRLGRTEDAIYSKVDVEGLTMRRKRRVHHRQK